MISFTVRMRFDHSDLDQIRGNLEALTAGSREEPGCISHAVHVECENALRLVFLERWADRAALGEHFKLPETLAFVRTLRELASAREGPDIYELTSSD